MDYTCQNISTLKNVILKNFSGNGVGMWYTFRGCTGLELVDCSLATSVPSIQTNTFDSTNNTFKIVVPDALVDSWKTATNWSARASQIISVSDYQASLQQ